MAPVPASLPRLFLALWPDARLRGELQAHQAAWHWPPGAALTPPGKLHLTLQFLGQVPPETAAALPRLPTVRAARFTAALNSTQTWRGGLAVLRPDEGEPAGLHALARALGAQISEMGLPVECRPFAPHITMARKATGARAPLEAPPILWTVRDYVLVASVQGRYEVLARWALDDGNG